MRSAFGTAIDTWDDKPLRGMHDGGRIDALADCVQRIQIGHRYTYDGDGDNRAFLGAGWSPPESAGVWSDNQRAHVIFRVRTGRPLRLILEGNFFLPRDDSAVTLRIEHEGSDLFTATCMSGHEAVESDGPRVFFGGHMPRRLVTRPFEPAHELVYIMLRIENAVSPLEAGLSNDDRLLGFLLRNLTVCEA